MGPFKRAININKTKISPYFEGRGDDSESSLLPTPLLVITGVKVASKSSRWINDKYELVIT